MAPYIDTNACVAGFCKAGYVDSSQAAVPSLRRYGRNSSTAGTGVRFASVGNQIRAYNLTPS